MAGGEIISELIGDWIVRRRNARRIAMLRERVRTTMIDRAFRRLEQSRFGLDDGEVAYGEWPHVPIEARLPVFRESPRELGAGMAKVASPLGYATGHNHVGTGL